MIAATHFDNLLVLLFFGIAVVFQLITAAAAKKRKRPGETRPQSTSAPQTARPLQTEDEETDQDRIRKFLEALGQPTTTTPPAPIQPRPTYRKPVVVLPRVGRMGSPLPPLTTRPPDLPEEMARRAQVAPEPPRKVFKSPVAQPESFEVDPLPPPIVEAEVRAAFQSPAAEAKTKPIEITALLRSTSGLRDAIILREIFGPPRSMQPLDLVGSV
jgi:hypothetical protein